MQHPFAGDFWSFAPAGAWKGREAERMETKVGGKDCGGIVEPFVLLLQPTKSPGVWARRNRGSAFRHGLNQLQDKGSVGLPITAAHMCGLE